MDFKPIIHDSLFSNTLSFVFMFLERSQKIIQTPLSFLSIIPIKAGVLNTSLLC